MLFFFFFCVHLLITVLKSCSVPHIDFNFEEHSRFIQKVCWFVRYVVFWWTPTCLYLGQNPATCLLPAWIHMRKLITSFHITFKIQHSVYSRRCLFIVRGPAFDTCVIITSQLCLSICVSQSIFIFIAPQVAQYHKIHTISLHHMLPQNNVNYFLPQILQLLIAKASCWLFTPCDYYFVLCGCWC